MIIFVFIIFVLLALSLATRFCILTTIKYTIRLNYSETIIRLAFIIRKKAFYYNFGFKSII